MAGAVAPDAAPAVVDAAADATSTADGAPGPLSIGPVVEIAFDCLPPGKARPVRQDLGHQSTIGQVVQVGDRIVSADAGGWILWDAAAGVELASAANGKLHGAAGASFLVQRSPADAPEIRALSNGAVTGTVPAGFTKYGLALDGSYVWGASPAKLTIWTAFGAEVRTENGDYAAAGIIAGTNPLRAVVGDAVTMIGIDTSVPVRSAPFPGSFRGWLADGTAFVMREGPTQLRIRDAAGAEIAELTAQAGATEIFGGREGHVWRSAVIDVKKRTLDVWDIGGPEPVQHVELGPREGVLESRGHVMVGALDELTELADMRPPATPVALFRLGVTITREEHAFPFLPSAFAVGPAGELSVAWRGVVTRPDVGVELGCGTIRAMHGVKDALAVVTHAGRVMVADIPTGALRFDQRNTGVVAATTSASGDAIAILRNDPSEDRVVAVPSGDVLLDVRRPVLSGDGTRALHTVPGVGVGVTVVATNVLEQPVLPLTVPYAGAISPDGRAFAVTGFYTYPDGYYPPPPRVNLVADGTSRGSYPEASIVAWLDDDTFLVHSVEQGGGGRPHLLYTGQAGRGRDGRLKFATKAPTPAERVIRQDRILSGLTLLDFDRRAQPLPFTVVPTPVGSRLVGVHGRALRYVTW